MTGQHFKEYAGTICVTLKISKTRLSEYLGISKVTYNLYEKNGVPIDKRPLIIQRAKKLLRVVRAYDIL